MATLALLIGSAVSSGGVAAVLASKLLAPKGEKSFVKSLKEENQRRKHVRSNV
jgi:hypothetical protein